MIIRPARGRAYGPPADGWPKRMAARPTPPTSPDPARPADPHRGEWWKRISYWWTYSAAELAEIAAAYL